MLRRLLVRPRADGLRLTILFTRSTVVAPWLRRLLPLVLPLLRSPAWPPLRRSLWFRKQEWESKGHCHCRIRRLRPRPDHPRRHLFRQLPCHRRGFLSIKIMPSHFLQTPLCCFQPHSSHCTATATTTATAATTRVAPTPSRPTTHGVSDSDRRHRVPVRR
jgi:hypothetical protein